MTNSNTKDTSVIPTGCYCYDNKGVCPYWSCEKVYEGIDWLKMRPTYYGKCSFLNISDHKETLSLFDQVKECGINDSWDDEIITIN